MSPRSSTHGITQVTLDANQGNPTDLGVFQALDVRAAPGKNAQLAQGLADVLGVGMNIGLDQIEKRSEQNSRAGILDTTMGAVDERRAMRDTAYADGVASIRTKQALFSAKAEWDAHYANDVDKTLSAPEVAKLYDEFMKERLATIAQDNPKWAAKLAPAYMQGMQELVVGHQAQLTAEHQREADAVMQQEVLEAAQTGNGINFFELVTDRQKVTGNLNLAMSKGIEAVGTAAATLGRPELLDEIPTAHTDDDGNQGDNPDFTADHRMAIARYREAAEQQRLKNLDLNFSLDWMGTEKAYADRIAARQTIGFEELVEKRESGNPKYSEEWAMGWYRRSLDVEAQNALDAAATQLPPVSGSFYALKGLLKPDNKPYTDEDIDQLVDRAAESRYKAMRESMPAEVPDEFVMALAAKEVSAREGRPYRPLASVLQNAPISAGQAFHNAANAYFELPTNLRPIYVPDKDRRILFERYDTGGRSQNTLSVLQNEDKDQVAANFERLRPGYREVVGKIGAQYLRDTTFPWEAPDVQVSELANADYAQMMIDAGVKTRLQSGVTDPTKALELATQDFIANHRLVDGKAGVRALPTFKGMTDSMVKAINWADKKLPEWGNGIEINGKKYAIEIPEGSYLSTDPTSREDKVLIVRSPVGIPIAPSILRFKPEELHERWRKEDDTANWTQAQRAQFEHQRWKQRWDQYQQDKAFGRSITPEPKL